MRATDRPFPPSTASSTAHSLVLSSRKSNKSVLPCFSTGLSSPKNQILCTVIPFFFRFLLFSFKHNALIIYFVLRLRFHHCTCVSFGSFSKKARISKETRGLRLKCGTWNETRSKTWSETRSRID